jgi:hypothetical protein
MTTSVLGTRIQMQSAIAELSQRIIRQRSAFTELRLSSPRLAKIVAPALECLQDFRDIIADVNTRAALDLETDRETLSTIDKGLNALAAKLRTL